MTTFFIFFFNTLIVWQERLIESLIPNTNTTIIAIHFMREREKAREIESQICCDYIYAPYTKSLRQKHYNLKAICCWFFFFFFLSNELCVVVFVFVLVCFVFLMTCKRVFCCCCCGVREKVVIKINYYNDNH